MAEQPEFDPRFDPAFQRGYEPTASRPAAPDRTPAVVSMPQWAAAPPAPGAPQPTAVPPMPSPSPTEQRADDWAEEHNPAVQPSEDGIAKEVGRSGINPYIGILFLRAAHWWKVPVAEGTPPGTQLDQTGIDGLPRG